jgi:hypothetical protein
MTIVKFTESVVEEAALAWLESLGYAVKHGPEIAPGEFFTERAAPVAENATSHMIKTPRATVPERKSLDVELSCG